MSEQSYHYKSDLFLHLTAACKLNNFTVFRNLSLLSNSPIKELDRMHMSVVDIVKVLVVLRALLLTVLTLDSLFRVLPLIS